MNDLPPPGSHIHLIAICGVGMASLAGLLKSRGYRVTGSDQNVYPPMSTYLADIGIDVLAGFGPEHVAPRPDLVVVGNAVSRSNPEAQAMLEQDIPHISFPQALGRFLIGSGQSLVSTGTHGKSTRTALLPLPTRSAATMAPAFHASSCTHAESFSQIQRPWLPKSTIRSDWPLPSTSALIICSAFIECSFFHPVSA